MKKKHFKESQILSILSSHEQGVSSSELCRTHQISAATFYRWKSKYGGVTSTELNRLRALESENKKLKELFANASLQIVALKDVLEKKY